MPRSRSDMADLGYFTSIARHRSFRLAGEEMGVSASAMSHALKGLEERLGVRLVERTNRSVSLTEAGTELFDAVREPLGHVDRALDRITRRLDGSDAIVRLAAPPEAAALLIAPVLPALIRRHPGVDFEVTARNGTDALPEGFDAAIRLGAAAAKDIASRRLSPDLRRVVAAAPSYLDRFGVPVVPEDLARHRCLRLREADGSARDWEFEGSGTEARSGAGAGVTVDDTLPMLAMALAGAGLMRGPEALFASHVASGGLRLVLEDHSVAGPGYHLIHRADRPLPPSLDDMAELISGLVTPRP